MADASPMETDSSLAREDAPKPETPSEQQDIDLEEHVDKVTVKPVAVGGKLAKKAADKITSAQELKQEGNDFFKSCEWKKAIRKYHHALMYAKGVVDKFEGIPGLHHKEEATPEEESSANELIAALSNNLAACLVKTEEWEKAAVHASKVLEIQPQNVKALYRRGVAKLNLNQLDGAESDLKRAGELDPEDTGIKKQLQTVQHRLKEYEKTEQQMYSAMFKS